jgi:hypothetical protein
MISPSMCTGYIMFFFLVVVVVVVVVFFFLFFCLFFFPTDRFTFRQSHERSSLLSGSSPVFQQFSACHSLLDKKTWMCYLTPWFASECLLSIPYAPHLNGPLTTPK